MSQRHQPLSSTSRTPLKSKTNTVAPPHSSPAPYKAVPIKATGKTVLNNALAPRPLAPLVDAASTLAPPSESPHPRSALIDSGIRSILSSSLNQQTPKHRRTSLNPSPLRDQLSTPKQDICTHPKPQSSQNPRPTPYRRPLPMSSTRHLKPIILCSQLSPVKSPISPSTRRRRLQQRHQYFSRVQAFQHGQPRTFIHAPVLWDDWIPAESVPDFQDIENLVVPELSALGKLSDGDAKFYYPRAWRARKLKLSARGTKPYRRCVRVAGVSPFALVSKGVRILRERRMYMTGVPYQT
ncbi:uncharacterized protein STEHIDRAFT_161687 [Stereum hirsutum FP-91666 SS1]|uniref:uncharacterized protein n=1 Tax=Stereum hirsutum (strain FP-91666) TaxID=721885 RepID=UPI000444A5F2|nr:uncharacterized protein STEHIDRAFT_161687 [Stereum hirsutum FP-91666 SS1]EIM81503.1 hypothetical protein STEHIDRAFT_161687 [Stereum hirsutum FP-91666 SS1]